MTQHTKGPWRIVTDGINHWIEIEPNKIALIKAGEADRNLIAAAPELLEALEVCLEAIQPYYDSDDDGSLEAKASNMALAAINKAKGL